MDKARKYKKQDDFKYQDPIRPDRKDISGRTDWGHVAKWYDKHLDEDDTYHAKVILPNLTRLLGDMKGQRVLDLACGQGYFALNWAKSAKYVYGIDLGLGLIKIAEENYKKEKEILIKNKSKGNSKWDKHGVVRGVDISKNSLAEVEFYVSPADNLEMIADGTLDKITCVLALQNIEEVAGVFKECERVLKKYGRMFIVLNHPSFRNPRNTHWGWDEEKKIIYSNTFVKIATADEIIYGNGMEASENFSDYTIKHITGKIKVKTKDLQ